MALKSLNLFKVYWDRIVKSIKNNYYSIAIILLGLFATFTFIFLFSPYINGNNIKDLIITLFPPFITLSGALLAVAYAIFSVFLSLMSASSGTAHPALEYIFRPYRVHGAISKMAWPIFISTFTVVWNVFTLSAALVIPDKEILIILFYPAVMFNFLTIFSIGYLIISVDFT